MSENPPFYEDLTLTTSDYGGAGRVLEEKEVGKHIAIGANILEGDPGVRNVISVPHAQRAIKVSFQEAMIRKDFANVPLRKSVSEKAGDTASFLLAKEIYEHCSKKPHLVSSSIQQGSRELNIKRKKDKRLLTDHAVNFGLLTNRTKIKERGNDQLIGMRDFLEKFGITYDLSSAYPARIEAAIEAIDPSSNHFEEIDASLSVIKSWFRYHRAIHERLKRRAVHHRKEDKGGRAVCLEVHTANPNKPGGIEIIVGTYYGSSCDFDLLIKYCQALKAKGLVVHDTLTELAFKNPERIVELEKTIPGIRQRIEAFKKYIAESGINIDSYHTSPEVPPEEKKKLHLAGTSILDLRRQVDPRVSAIQIEVPRDIILQPEKRELIAQATAEFLQGIQ